MGSPEFPEVPGPIEQSTGEDFNPRHFYAAYIYQYAEAHERDITTLLESAQELGYPVRYWWVSEVMDIWDSMDRLIICVHHPTTTGDAGVDLYDALKAQQVKWDELEAATVEEYRQFGKQVNAMGKVQYPDGGLLFPPGEPTVLEWRAAQQPLAMRFEWESPHLTDLPGLERRRIRQALGQITLLMTSVLKQKEAVVQAGTELNFIFTILTNLMDDIAAMYQLTPEQRVRFLNQFLSPDQDSPHRTGLANESLSHQKPESDQPETEKRAAFTAWFNQVDIETMDIAGCSIHDLPDIDFWSLFDDEASPAEAAKEALREAGYPDLDW